MAESFFKRLAGRDAAPRDLQASVDALAAAVGELAASQRKQAVQLKRLHETQKEQDHRWQGAVERWQLASNENHRRELHEAVRTQEKLQKSWQSVIGSLQERLKTERKWRLIFSRQVDAVMRHLQLGRMKLAPPHDLTARRFRLRSRNEEDGIILALLEHAGVTDQRFVEIGSGRSGGNAAMLAYECGWSGLMIDIVPMAIDHLRAHFGHNPGVVGVAVAVSPDNLNPLLTEHGFTGDVDLLSIDIDSYDYWVLEALSVCTPRLLIVEYNAGFGSQRAVTVPLNQPLAGTPKVYRGASLAALEKAARRKGYRLVVCDPTGVNAFFLRHDVAPDVPGLTVAEAFRPALSRWDLSDAPMPEDGLALGDAYPLVEV